MGAEPLALLFAVAASVSATVAVTAWRRRRAASAVGMLAVVSAAIAEWSLVSGIMTLTGDGGAPRMLWALLFLGVCLVPPGFLCLSRALTDRGWRLRRRTALLLAVEPLTVVTGIATDPWHHWFFSEGGRTLEPSTYTPLVWVHLAYSYTLLMIATVRVFRAWLRGPRSQRTLYGLTLLSTVPPTAGNLLNVAGVVQGVDLSPVGFCFTVVVSYWLFVRRSLHELVPVARQNVVDMIDDMVVTVDRSVRILDLNPAADRLVRRLSPDLPDRLTGLPMNEVLCDVSLTEGTRTDRIYADYLGSGVDLNVRVSPMHDGRGDHIGWAVVARDITALNRHRRELERANARLSEQLRTIEALRSDLAEQAVRDALTGLHNRRHLMDALCREVERAGRERSPLSVAVLDIDHFKQVNDRHGHRAGDRVLVRFAELLTAGSRPGEIVARHGGEEFVVLFPGVTGEHALARLEELRRTVEADSVRADGRPLSVTFSAGVAVLAPGQSPDDLLHAADQALYAAKRGGRNRIERAGPGPSTAAA
ncbi:diguanylate cyclase [Planomonospora venezuelensis]|uniref:Diguanylate cyclase (GGDEF)-like protein n=1 Tax=Planomonospora venezuelensis TaxID=1999 RepID=A0A841D5H7_PLAVE|nr:diguanylate cyclase (GGDEF)-like protein [Planomonospora venezuelensis]GIN01396.1 GGDEF domain-containing protein [Planomonospora venezuelensis]